MCTESLPATNSAPGGSRACARGASSALAYEPAVERALDELADGLEAALDVDTLLSGG